MILVKVNHYLIEKGLDYFPIWFENLFECISKKRGFVDIAHSINKYENICNIVLLFDNKSNLNNWATSSEHDKIVGKLDEYRTKPWSAERYYVPYQKIDNTQHNIELVGYELCPFTQRINILLNEKNINHKITYINIFNKPEWFEKISPLKEIPILKFNDKIIFKSSAICEFLNDELCLDLHPKNNFERANSRSWIEFCNALTIDVYNMSLSKSIDEYSEKIKIVNDKLEKINNIATETPYFYGNQFTMVDICFSPIFIRINALDDMYKTNFFEKFKNLKIWHEELIKKDSVRHSCVDDYSTRLNTLLTEKLAYISNKENFCE